MTSDELIPAAILKSKAVVYVRQSTQSQVMTNLEGNGASMIWSMSPANTVSSMSKSLTTISAGRRAELWRALALIAWWPGCARARSAPFCASMLPGSRETVAIGIICLNCVGLLKPASLMARASITLVGQMIACFLA